MERDMHHRQGSAPAARLRALALALYALVGQRGRLMGTDERGLETLEYALLIGMGVGILLLAVNALGGSISGLITRLINDINGIA